MWIPIAATGTEEISKYVGEIEKTRLGRHDRVNAVLVRPFVNEGPETARLWREKDAATWREHLYPGHQVWVHVDYHGYRKAYQRFGMPDIPEGYFLDHIQNRRAIRARGYSHPYLRLCPISRLANTNSGHSCGGEGLERAFVTNLKSYSQGIQEDFAAALAHPIVYADPVDISKMLGFPPGTRTLDGVRDIQALFYPA